MAARQLPAPECHVSLAASAGPCPARSAAIILLTQPLAPRGRSLQSGSVIIPSAAHRLSTDPASPDRGSACRAVPRSSARSRECRHRRTGAALSWASAATDPAAAGPSPYARQRSVRQLLPPSTCAPTTAVGQLRRDIRPCGCNALKNRLGTFQKRSYNKRIGPWPLIPIKLCVPASA